MKEIFLLLLLFSLLLSSCKPTEKGYKAAYDAALGKREAVKSDLGVDLPEGTFQSVDGPQLKDVDGKKVYVLNQRIKPSIDGMSLPGKYNVAVGSYKMITNCKAQAEALQNEGYEAFPAQESDGVFYTVAASFQEMSDAVKFYEKYKESKDRVYVGLPGSPVIIYSPR